MYVCATAGPLGPVAQTDSHTHISPPTTAEHSAGWMGERLVGADWPGLLHSLDLDFLFPPLEFLFVCKYFETSYQKTLLWINVTWHDYILLTGCCEWWKPIETLRELRTTCKENITLCFLPLWFTGNTAATSVHRSSHYVQVVGFGTWWELRPTNCPATLSFVPTCLYPQVRKTTNTEWDCEVSDIIAN